MTASDSRRPTPIPTSTAGLSICYRLRWRTMYGLLVWGGPPHRSLDRDPRERMRQERAARVERALAERAGRAAGEST